MSTMNKNLTPIIEAAESFHQTMMEIEWTLKSFKSKRFIFKSSAQVFSALKHEKLNHLYDNDIIKSYELVLIISLWPRMVVYRIKSRGERKKPTVMVI